MVITLTHIRLSIVENNEFEVRMNLLSFVRFLLELVYIVMNVLLQSVAMDVGASRVFTLRLWNKHCVY
jgi:hypothetical protein